MKTAANGMSAIDRPRLSASAVNRNRLKSLYDVESKIGLPSLLRSFKLNSTRIARSDLEEVIVEAVTLDSDDSELGLSKSFSDSLSGNGVYAGGCTSRSDFKSII